MKWVKKATPTLYNHNLLGGRTWLSAMHRAAAAASPASSLSASEVPGGGADIQGGMLHAHAGSHRPFAAGSRHRRPSPQDRVGTIGALQIER